MFLILYFFTKVSVETITLKRQKGSNKCNSGKITTIIYKSDKKDLPNKISFGDVFISDY